jgi:hypothetical protein
MGKSSKKKAKRLPVFTQQVKIEPVNETPIARWLNSSMLEIKISRLNQNLEVMVFEKYGEFLVDEIIGYELIANNSSERVINIMLLAKQIAEDLNWSHGEAVNMLNLAGSTVFTELIPYADEMDNIGLYNHSDHRRKKEIVTFFIQQRIDSNWSQDQTGKMPRSALQEIYSFCMNEYHEWKELPLLQLSDLGKQSSKSEPEPEYIPAQFGTDITIGYRPEELPIPDSTETNSADSQPEALLT